MQQDAEHGAGRGLFLDGPHYLEAGQGGRHGRDREGDAGDARCADQRLLRQRGGRIRADGRMVHGHVPLRGQESRPKSTRGVGTTTKLRATIPGDEAFLPLAQVALARWSRN